MTAPNELGLAEHPRRRELNDEVHARPPEAMRAPLRLSYLAFVSGNDQREAEWAQVGELAERYAAEPPDRDSNHYAADLGPFRLRFERHTEFARYQFLVPGAGPGDDPFADRALAAVPAEWRRSLPGELIAAVHGAVLPVSEPPRDFDALSRRYFAGNPIVGSRVSGDAATAVTDFRIRADGFGRLLVLDHGMTPQQAGRLVQRLLEIETYRMMALLAFPVARSLGPFLGERETELVGTIHALTTAEEEDEPRLLDRLTRLEAEIDSRESDNHYRFAAAAAYNELVQRRIAELRERRIEGLQTFREFTERRLAPAMQTCRAVAVRLSSLSERVSRASQLLSTRVAMTREQQNQQLLESMDRRARLQLRLQETVEGLSAAAATYYIVGLVGYAAGGLAAVGVEVNVAAVTAVSIPLVVLLVVATVRRIRRMIRLD